MGPIQYVKEEAGERGLGLGAKPTFPVHELITSHHIKNVIAELPSGDEFFWEIGDFLEARLGTTMREHVNHNALCSECVKLSCSINDVYSFRATLTDGVVTTLEVFSLERGEFSSETFSTHTSPPLEPPQ